MTPASQRGITTVDAHYMYPGRAAAYLIEDKGEAAFVDTGTRFSVPHLMAALKAAGRAPEDVKYLIVTHVHLDHSGGAPELAKACPRAEILCHGRSERHLIDPTKLIASATPIYGADKFGALYGVIDPIPANRVRVVAEGESVTLGGRTLEFLDTPGHAKHHISVLDRSADAILTGDAFGLSYSYLQRGKTPYCNYVCAPPQFEPDVAKVVVKRIMDLGVSRAYVTHFGPCDAVQEGGKQLLRVLDTFNESVNRAAATDLEGPKLLAFCAEEALQITKKELGISGLDVNDPEVMRWALSEHSVTSQGMALLASERRAGRAA